MSRSENPQEPNALIQEKSPYLLQHAYNPVQWLPWGEAAFNKSREEDRPIFLSVGYSTCHWCHVMEHESFENEEIAAIMNENFVNIKVDREERPDVDAAYMQYVQLRTGQGGWPMSVWLTPERKPFFGGTYFPAEERYGRAGFGSILKQIAELWRTRRDDLMEEGQRTIEVMQEQLDKSQPANQLPGAVVWEQLLTEASGSYDEELGGFGGAPKFPRPALLEGLISLAVIEGRHSESGKRALEISYGTLQAMARGGMYDHLGGGFHRYSVDEYWHVPHFEKMIYDQAQLIPCYLEGARLTGDDGQRSFFEEKVRETLEYVRVKMTSPEGGFYCAEDADSLVPGEEGMGEKKEGAYYVWTSAQIDLLLLDEKQRKLFKRAYGVEEAGNVRAESDPHDEFRGQNVLFKALEVQPLAQFFNLETAEVARHLAEAKATLLEAREHRPHPHLDDKILAAWNGMMIGALADASRILDEDGYLQAAVKGAEFIRANLWKADEKKLIRTFREGPSEIAGFATDYAWMIRACLKLFRAGAGIGWIKWAMELQQTMTEQFWDEAKGGFFASKAGDREAVLTFKEDYDGAEPSANSVAALNLVELENLVPQNGYREMAEKTVQASSELLKKHPYAAPLMVKALRILSEAPRHMVIAQAEGEEAQGEAAEMVKLIEAHVLPLSSVVRKGNSAEEREFFQAHNPAIAAMNPESGAAVYICENFSCQAPITRAEVLRELLAKAP